MPTGRLDAAFSEVSAFLESNEHDLGRGMYLTQNDSISGLTPRSLECATLVAQVPHNELAIGRNDE
jgi:hypothetical protein